MNKNEKHENREIWKMRIDECKKSGKTNKEYCKENGLPEHQFYYWQARLKPVEKLNKNKNFLPVTIKDDKCSTEIKIKLPFGIEIEGREYPNITWLTNLINSCERFA